MNKYQQRINYRDDIAPILRQVCGDFDIGQYRSYSTIALGYEDYNLSLTTSCGKYFVKIFGAYRKRNECQRCVNILKNILDLGVSHPRLLESKQGYLYEFLSNDFSDRLIVMQFIEGNNFYELGQTPNAKEKCFIIEQAALINKSDINPPPLYDCWAIVNFGKEYQGKKQYLKEKDKRLIGPLVEAFNSLAIDELPHCFVHGDIIKTNVMRSIFNQIYILDFSVANYYPRIQELAVIICNLFFDYKSPNEFLEKYNFAIEEYQKHILLLGVELEKLPLFLKLGHAMHILLASYEKNAHGNNSLENDYFLKNGLVGLELINKIFD